MKLNDLVHEYTNLMSDAQAATSRQEALDCIRKASRIQDTISLLKESERLLEKPYSYR